MEGESAATLVQDLVSRMSALVDEFGRRADAAGSAAVAPGSDGAADPVDEAALVAAARRLLDQRARRARYLPAELFHEPAWDMLLALFIARAERRPTNVKTLVSYAHSPVTTSQRWIDHLGRLGLVERNADPVDRRRIEVRLSPAGEAAMRRLLAAIG